MKFLHSFRRFPVPETDVYASSASFPYFPPGTQTHCPGEDKIQRKGM